jgi:Superinfection immunity protein
VSGAIATIIVIIITLGLYFVPTMIAADRKNHTGAIFALNLFLGWTLIGWVAALVLALWNDGREEASA